MNAKTAIRLNWLLAACGLIVVVSALGLMIGGRGDMALVGVMLASGLVMTVVALIALRINRRRL
ncbi:hypothetical protein [Schumannella sp. 10F1B-5-1]|uniref:hypothetical protein n=1 Tax=Schumannella sp. 10F1B-5-1 TaxID=2590780 RepID=UPI0011322D93|nr:hypothetical protein [Schumannella sp. 10F1B-5-1]TPW73059.1 hypothetical protein FJ658_07370 [Schumannella sp. 10F1B-5-1]